MVLAAPRTGSNWLCTLLDSHPEVLCHHEIFNPEGLHYSLRLRDGSFDLGTVAERGPRARGRAGAGLAGEPRPSRRGLQAEPRPGRAGVPPGARPIPGCARSCCAAADRIRTFVSEAMPSAPARWESYGGSGTEAGAGPAPAGGGRRRRCGPGWPADERYYEELESALRAGGRPHLSLVYERLGGRDERRRMLRFLDVAERPELLTGAPASQPLPSQRDDRQFRALAQGAPG